MRRRHHGESVTVAPDPFIKGKIGEILYRTHDSYDNAAAWINATDWDDPSMPVNSGQGMKAALSTIEIDEIEWTSQSLPLDYGKGNNRDPQWMKHFRYTEADVAKWSTLSYYDFVKTVGGPSYPSAGFDGVFYNVQNHSRLKSWGMYKPNQVPPTAQNNITLIESVVKPGKQYGPGPMQLLDNHTVPVTLEGLANYLKKNRLNLSALSITSDTDGGIATIHIEKNRKLFIEKAFPIKKGVTRFEVNADFTDISAEYRLVVELRKDSEGRLPRWLFNYFEGVPAYSDHDKGIIGSWYRAAYEHSASDPCLGVEVSTYQHLDWDETFRWRIPNQEHVMQLIGQAPVTNEDLYFRMRDFLNVTPAEAHRVSNQITQTGLNTSGFSLYPVGSREQPQEKQFYSFGNLSLFRCGETAMGTYNTLKRFNLVTNNDGVIDSVLFNNTQHAAQIRHCKVKTDSELGYSLYIDELKDKVLMLPYNASSAVVEYLPHEMCYENNGSKGIVNDFSQQWQMAIKVDITNGLALNIQTNTNVEKSYVHLFDKDMNFIKPLKVYPKEWRAISDRISLKDIPTNAKYAVIHNNPGQYFEANVEYDDYDSRSTSQLRHGLERGIALRYTNRKHMKVLRKWSEIKAEAAEINSQILVR